MRFRAVNAEDNPRRRDAEAAFKDWHSRYGCETFLMEDSE